MGEPFHGIYKLDSHTYKTIEGKKCTIIKYMDWSCDVSPFSEKLTPMKDIPIVSAATGFTLANSRNYILVFHEALYMNNMRHTLINTNQCRHFGEKVQDNPYHEDCLMSIESPDKEFAACLHSVGNVMLLYTWFPMQVELKSYPHIELPSCQHWSPQKKLCYHKKNIQCKRR